MSKYGVELMKNRRGVSDQAGFSLLETLIALVVLGVGLLALELLQIGAMKGNADSIDRTTAVNLAQSIVEDLKKRPLSDGLLADNGDNGNNLDDGRAAAGGQPAPAQADHRSGSISTVNGQVFTVFWNVDDGEPIAGVKTLRLFVYWNDQRFGLRKVVTTTVLGGLY
jgi:type IV pilus modification protein PilV